MGYKQDGRREGGKRGHTLPVKSPTKITSEKLLAKNGMKIVISKADHEYIKKYAQWNEMTLTEAAHSLLVFLKQADPSFRF